MLLVVQQLWVGIELLIFEMIDRAKLLDDNTYFTPMRLSIYRFWQKQNAISQINLKTHEGTRGVCILLAKNAIHDNIGCHSFKDMIKY